MYGTATSDRAVGAAVASESVGRGVRKFGPPAPVGGSTGVAAASEARPASRNRSRYGPDPTGSVPNGSSGRCLRWNAGEEMGRGDRLRRRLQEPAKRRREVQRDRQRVDGRRADVPPRLRTGPCVRRVAEDRDGERDVIRRERRSVLPSEVGSQMERPRAAPVGDVPAGREVTDDGAVGPEADKAAEEQRDERSIGGGARPEWARVGRAPQHALDVAARWRRPRSGLDGALRRSDRRGQRGDRQRHEGDAQDGRDGPVREVDRRRDPTSVHERARRRRVRRPASGRTRRGRTSRTARSGRP